MQGWQRRQGVLKVCPLVLLATDFGLSKEAIDHEKAYSFCGTVEYMAPVRQPAGPFPQCRLVVLWGVDGECPEAVVEHPASLAQALGLSFPTCGAQGQGGGCWSLRLFSCHSHS